MKMSGHTVLITGGTSGIGKALAAQLLKRGNTVLITGRSEDRLAEARQVLPGPAKALRLMGRLKPHATLRAALAAAMGK